MSDYLDMARRALAEFASRSIVPPADQWPESLLDLARERAAQTGDAEAARNEVWLSWCEWNAQGLNRLFQEQGLTGQPGHITAETVRDGMDKAARRRAKR